MSSLRTPLSRVEGLGSAKMGTRDFWHQRLTAIALVPLAIWFALAALKFVGADYQHTLLWLRMPWNALLLILFIVVLARHLAIGMQVIVEDYIHHEGAKLTLIVLVKFGTWLIAATGIFMVLGIVL
jgi:succinate dehydrogenase / fumarate reductase, membrane anchor subunit